MANKSNQAYKIAMVGLLAALSYVVFTYGQVKITLPGGDATSIHLGNADKCLRCIYNINRIEKVTYRHADSTSQTAVKAAD